MKDKCLQLSLRWLHQSSPTSILDAASRRVNFTRFRRPKKLLPTKTKHQTLNWPGKEKKNIPFLWVQFLLIGTNKTTLTCVPIYSYYGRSRVKSCHYVLLQPAAEIRVDNPQGKLIIIMKLSVNIFSAKVLMQCDHNLSNKHWRELFNCSFLLRHLFLVIFLCWNGGFFFLSEKLHSTT